MLNLVIKFNKYAEQWTITAGLMKKKTFILDFNSLIWSDLIWFDLTTRWRQIQSCDFIHFQLLYHSLLSIHAVFSRNRPLFYVFFFSKTNLYLLFFPYTTPGPIILCLSVFSSLTQDSSWFWFWCFCCCCRCFSSFHCHSFSWDGEDTVVSYRDLR